MNNENFISMMVEDVIRVLSDRSYQERVWVRGEGPECSSFDEAINNFYYFYDLLEANADQSEKSRIKVIQDLRLLEKMIRAYCDNTPMVGDDKQIVPDPKWDEIRQFAKKIYDEYIQSEKLS